MPALRPGELPSSLRRAHHLSAAVGAGTTVFLGRRRPGDDVAHGEPFISHPTTAYPFVFTHITDRWAPLTGSIASARASMVRQPRGKAYSRKYVFDVTLSLLPGFSRNSRNSFKLRKFTSSNIFIQM